MNEVQPFVSRHEPTAQVYGVSLNPDRLHFDDGTHKRAGEELAARLDAMMRAANPDASADAQLCPGCYMLTLFNASLYLAAQNGQDPRQLAATMERVFHDLGAYLDAGGPGPVSVLALSHLKIVEGGQ